MSVRTITAKFKCCVHCKSAEFFGRLCTVGHSTACLHDDCSGSEYTPGSLLGRAAS